VDRGVVVVEIVAGGASVVVVVSAVVGCEVRVSVTLRTEWRGVRVRVAVVYEGVVCSLGEVPGAVLQSAPVCWSWVVCYSGE
jgi:hypothetical protein